MGQKLSVDRCANHQSTWGAEVGELDGKADVKAFSDTEAARKALDYRLRV
jgi:hypothetical protein